MARIVVNNEQLEAEMNVGLREPIEFIISRTTLAHVVMASLVLLPNCHAPGSTEIFQAFIRDAKRIGNFGPETLRLMQKHTIEA